MKRFLCGIVAVLLITVCTQNSCALKYYGRYLNIEGGKSQVTLCAGEKLRLRTRCGLFGLPVYKNLRYFSSNILVASVDRSGVVRANLRGKTYITVTDSRGRTDSILVSVEGNSKIGAYSALFLVFLVAAVIVFRKLRK